MGKAPEWTREQQAKVAAKIAERVDNVSAFARRIGVTQGEMRKIVSGERRLYADRLFAIARELGVSTDYLLDETRDKPDPRFSQAEERLLWLLKKAKIDPEDISAMILRDVPGTIVAKRQIDEAALRPDEGPPDLVNLTKPAPQSRNHKSRSR